jgi:hypothetical protein
MHRPIPSCPGYAISKDGRVVAKARLSRIGNGRLARHESRSLSVQNGQYKWVSLWVGTPKRQVARQIHRLLWETFVEPIPEGMVINHKDGDKYNNDLSNLEVVTPSDNALHAVRTGLAHPCTVAAREASAAKGNPGQRAAAESRSRKVQQVSPDGKTVGTYNSMRGAAVSANRSVAGISRACASGLTCGGFYWNKF